MRRRCDEYLFLSHKTSPTHTATPPVVKATGEAHTAPNDLYAVMHALATRGPLTISIDADEWHLYKEGIFDASFNKSKTTINVDHTVQLVGYGEDEEGNLFWTVRNSWGVDFGESGFIRLRRSSPHAVPCKCPTYIPNCTVGDNGIYRTASEAAKEDTLICGADGILGDVSYPTGVYHIESTIEPHRRETLQHKNRANAHTPQGSVCVCVFVCE